MTEARGGTAGVVRVRRGARSLLRHAELGDAVLLLYAAAFAREYFWLVGNQPLAWVLTALCAASVTCVYVAARGERQSAPAQFWLAVAVPLVFVYALRAPFTDASFDVFNYRLFNAERALRGTLYRAGDFFPVSGLSPTPDIATGIARHLLGYRLGTMANLLATVWAAQVVERLLRPYVRGAWRRSACVLSVVLAEHLLFEINEYMVDALAVPLILEAVCLATRREGGRLRSDIVRAAFLLGLAAALKITNVTVAAPVALLFALALAREGRAAAREFIVTPPAALAAFLLPLAPYAVYLYATTGNPVFPVYNAVFKSPYLPQANLRDGRFGPAGAWEAVLWPLRAAFEPARLSELGVYSGRVTLGFAVALACLCFVRRDARLRALAFVFLLDSLLWSASTGYVRYVLHLELLAGVLVVALAATLARSPQPARRPPRLALASLLLASLAAQSALACYYTLRYEWGGRPTLLTSPSAYLDEAKFVLRDRRLMKYLPAEERALVGGVGAWVMSGMKTSGAEALLRPDVPVVGVREPGFFATEAGRAKFADALALAAGKSVWSLCEPGDLPTCRSVIQERGLAVAREIPVTIPYYSGHVRMNLVMLEVERAAPSRATGR